MKKSLFVTTVVLLSFFVIAFNGFGAEKPQYGGIMRIIDNMGPKVIGYYPEMGPTDHAGAFPGIECLVNLNEKRVYEPQLAESVDIDYDKLTMTFKLRKGVKFHDGSDFNAKVAAWNYKMLLDTKKLQFSDQIGSVEIVDDYTIVLHLKSYNNQMYFAFGWVPMLSQAAFEKNGIEWCRAHLVGTGPFMQKEWKRDAYLKWEKFPDYWDKGKPYLDGIEYIFIPDEVTASQMMQAKEADLWRTPPVRERVNMQKMGFIDKQYWTGLPGIIYLNTKDPNAPTANPKVRMAIEYAIDKEAIAKALGFGLYTPLYLIHPEGNWAHDPNYKPRTYNPEKARQLLAEAGYPNGLKLQLMTFGTIGGGKDAAEAVKRYMDEVGILVEVDIADPGRYWGSVFGSGWKDMVLCFTGIDANSLGTIQAWFGHQPKTNLASFKRSEKLLELSKKSVTLRDAADQEKISREIAVAIADDALMIPLMHMPAGYLTQPWVHTNYLECGLIRWKLADAWMEKH